MAAKFVRLTGCYDGNCPAGDLAVEAGPTVKVDDCVITGYLLAPEEQPEVAFGEGCVCVPPGTVLEFAAALVARGMTLPDLPV